MNGGKDVKFGHDKRPISTVSNSEVNLFNYQTGKPLIDESGNPLVTEQDEFFLSDATASRSTSVVFDKVPNTFNTYKKHSLVGVVTSTYGIDLDVYVGSASSLPVLQVNGNVVGAAKTALQASGYFFVIDGHPGISTLSDGIVEVKTANQLGSVPAGGERNKIYFDDSVGIQTVTGVKIGDKVTGSGIPDGSFVTRVNRRRLIISNDVNVGLKNSKIRIRRTEDAVYKADNIIRVEEQFKESSEVSRTLLGIDRAETQLSLFSNVSSYGLDETEFEEWSDVGGISLDAWRNRVNATYGAHYEARVGEETMESAITLESFPTGFTFPFGPKYENIGFYQKNNFDLYKKFIEFGNKLYRYFANNDGNQGWGSDWANKFLNPGFVSLNDEKTDVEYRAGITTSFAEVDKWTETWRDIKDNEKFVSPDGKRFDDLAIGKLDNTNIGNEYKTSNTRPGYSETARRFASLQSRRIFRYQPGRISGFTFGVKTSDEPVTGYFLEWGLTNPTDNYVFHVYGGQISIRRRSTIPLDSTAIARSGLNPLTTEINLDGVFYDSIQPQIPYYDSGLHDDENELYNLDIPRGNWNGDRLDGNGESGYQLILDRVTMWKIEFGWYGAIGVRFYAYVPVNNGDARWVVLHTIVIENSLAQPCLQDSYFRLRYIMDIYNTSQIRQPVFLYKYGASYYIDGGDEGAQTIFAINSGIKSTFPTPLQKSIVGITPKAFITSSSGVDIPNRKLIIPKEAHVSSDSLTKVQVVTCKACPGFAHAYTPGVASTDTGRSVKISLEGNNEIGGIGTHYFYETDVGAKLISHGGLYNWYIESINGANLNAPKKDGYTAHDTAIVLGFGPGVTAYPNKHEPTGNRTIANLDVKDNIAGIITTTPVADKNAGIGGTFGYPMVEDGYPVLLSNYNHQFACDFKFTGSVIEIQFLNPLPRMLSHASDFYIGLTDKKPLVSLPDILTGWDGVNWIDVNGSPQTGIETSILTKKDILYGEYTHDYVKMDEDGVELYESYWDRGKSSYRMAIDDRIPNPKGDASGKCSKLTFTVMDPFEITEVSQLEGDNPDGTGGRGFYLQRTPGLAFPSFVNEFDEGQVAVLQDGIPTANPAKFVGVVREYDTVIEEKTVTIQYIEIDRSLGTSFESGQFSIFVRPLKVEGSVMPTKTKLYNFEPWPFYLTGNMRDNSAINNITVKETVGNFTRTITPKLYVQDGSIEVTDANGQAGLLGEAPPHYKEVSRLSSAFFDDQNEQNLRPGIVRDTFYVGNNDAQVVDMSKIFNVDRDTITPDNQNLEATFFVAEKIDEGTSGQIEATVIYTEQ